MQTLETNINQLNSDIQGIKTAIVEAGVEVADGTPVAEYGGKVTEVYDAGKQAEYDAFWDAFQQNGNRTIYNSAFSYGWDNKNFRPKYDIVPTGGCTSMFASMLFVGDLVDHLNELGITLDLSKATNTTTLFNGTTGVTHLGVLDFSSSSSSDYALNNCTSLHTVDLLRLKADGSVSVTGIGINCGKLVNLTVDGVIGKTRFEFGQSTKLSKESIISIINALSTTTSGLTATFSKTAVNNAFGIDVDDPTTYPEGSEWYELRNSKSNWTISFA